MKKALKILGGIIITLFLILLIVPFAFQSQIKDLVKNYINDNLNAKVEFTDVDLSLIQNFPKAHVSIDNLVITNNAPFKDETFATVKSISFSMPLPELFKNTSEGPMVINSIHVNEAMVTLKTDKLGNNNYDITKEGPETPTTEDSAENGFAFEIEDYSINNSAITYLDETSKMEVYITELNHSGKGVFSAETSELDTETETNVSFSMDSTNYLTNNHFKLDALLALDLENGKYTFKENKALINQLPLEFDGYVQLLDEGQDIDLTFQNPGSSFKDFLALIPETYSKDLDKVETNGDFKISGAVKGLLSEETIPTFNIAITSNNAAFKYPDLPKGINDITINTIIKNETGEKDNTFVDIKTLNFAIDQDKFKSSATIRNLTSNMQVQAFVDGVLNLSNLTKAYPISLENELSGILKGNVNTSFDMDAVENNRYERIKTSGNLTLTNLVYSSEGFQNPIQIETASLDFNPSIVNVTNFKARTGQSDLQMNGSLKNFMGFIFGKNKLQGNFNLNSNNLVVSDFMTSEVENEEETSTNNAESSPTKIPDFLDCTIQAKANTVVYDNLELKNLNGTLSIKDQEANLQNMTANIFDGTLALMGTVSTKNDTPTFNMNLGAEDFDISKSFKDLELLQALAPIAKFLEGQLNTTISLNGNLDEQLTPSLNSISGSAFAELLTREINTSNSPLLNQLDNTFNFIDFDALSEKDLKTDLVFDNGQVNVKPFKLAYKDIDIEISGSHGFDQNMNYKAVLDVPAKYLGSEVNRLIGKINDNEVNNISIPVTANITGAISNPAISTDLNASVSKLTQQLIEIQKEKLLNEGAGAIKDLLSGIGQAQESAHQESATDSTETTTNNSNTVQQGIKNVLGGLLNKQKKESDSIK